MAKAEVFGDEELIAKLRRLRSFEVLRKPMRSSLLLIADRMSQYPRRKRGVRRSNKLKRGWKRAKLSVRASFRGIQGKITNKVFYAPWIQGQGRQFDSNKQLWPTETEIVLKSRADIERLHKRAIDEVLED